MSYAYLKLTHKEADLFATILGFIEAGEVSGGPLDDESKHQVAANLRLFKSLRAKTENAQVGACINRKPPKGFPE